MLLYPRAIARRGDGQHDELRSRFHPRRHSWGLMEVTSHGVRQSNDGAAVLFTQTLAAGYDIRLKRVLEVGKFRIVGLANLWQRPAGA
jgi:hypothetical protein